MKNGASKRRINIHISQEAERLLKRTVADGSASKGAVVDDALKLLLSDKADETELAKLNARIAKLTRAMERIADETTAQTETLALYILYYFCITPPLPDESRASADALGRKRFDRFVGQVGDRLLGKERYTGEVLARIDLVRANDNKSLEAVQ